MTCPSAGGNPPRRSPSGRGVSRRIAEASSAEERPWKGRCPLAIS
jgi:hypothetical protein